MDSQDLRTLRLLEEIEKSQTPSQRDLARKLDVSLGLVNSFIKRLANKGYFKVTTIPKNRVRYILTPKGAAEKTRLTYEYVQYSLRFYKVARENLKDLFTELEREGRRKIVFFGTGDLAEIAYVTLKETGLDLVGVVDDDTAGRRFLGVPVLNTDDIARMAFDAVAVVSLDADGAERKLRGLGVPGDRIVRAEPV
ncbi:MAG: winged helix-turn-helix transcriptional regulator [Desulfatibacillaceae bacterium]